MGNQHSTGRSRLWRKRSRTANTPIQKDIQTNVEPVDVISEPSTSASSIRPHFQNLVLSPDFTTENNRRESPSLSGRHYHDSPTEREPSVSDETSEESYESDVYSSDPEEEDQDNVSADFIGNYTGFGEMEPVEGPDFLCLSEEQLLEQQDKLVMNIVELLQISKVAARELLKHFHWDSDRLVQAYFEDPRKVCAEAKVDTTLDGGAIQISGIQECSVCGEMSQPEDSTALSCQHRFCNDCWETYLMTKITEGEVLGITCPSYKCKVIVSDDVIRMRIAPDLYDKYKRFIGHMFVETSRHVGWCPAPNCGRAVNAMDVVHGAVTCSCSHRFCFRCKNEAHAPATCEQVKLWQEKCRDDSETQNWINSFTQCCPKCDSAIEKNGGCNHMICRSCRHEFCWVCLSDWKGHADYYSCNRFEKKKKQEEKKDKKTKKDKKSKKAQAASNREEAKLALEKYLHYNHRFLNHARSREFELEAKEKAQKAMLALQESDNSSCGEVQYIAEATEQLISCRSVLKYTYVFSYYLLDDSTEKTLFEYLQEELEKATEHLAEALESKTSTRQRVTFIDLTRIAQSRMNNLLTAVDQGLSTVS